MLALCYIRDVRKQKAHSYASAVMINDLLNT